MPNDRVQLVTGDITTASVDAIVNAANPIMLGGGGVDGAIHRAAGPALIEACRKVRAVNGIRCPVGEARITEAGNLSSTYVIHTVGPRYYNDPEPHALLTSAYQNSLALAYAHECDSIAFPAISCGVYRFPLDEAAELALDVCFRDEWEGMTIFFYLYDNPAWEAWSEALDTRRVGGAQP
jgi:O-acetyl-ADP-ribose deacetylase (regulator of RNase III)